MTAMTNATKDATDPGHPVMPDPAPVTPNTLLPIHLSLASIDLLLGLLSDAPLRVSLAAYTEIVRQRDEGLLKLGRARFATKL